MFHMQNESGAMVGKNGVRIFDVGECWRASSGADVVNPQVLDYQTRGGQKDGTKYALGPDRLTGRTRIAYIDYPKKLYELDKLLDDDEVVHILTHCNVCSAVDQVINQPRQPLNRREQSSPPASHHPSPPSDERVSLGDVFSPRSGAHLPKYLTTGINIGKSLGLRPTGNALFTLGLSVLSDLASGVVQDPAYRKALQSFSDDMVDTITPELVSSIKEDAVKIAEAMEKDHTALMSRDFLVKHMVKKPSDIKNELAERSQSQSPHRNSDQYPDYHPVSRQPIRLWGE